MSGSDNFKGIRRRRTMSPADVHQQQESKQSELPATPLGNHSSNIPINSQTGGLRSLLGLDYLLGSSSPKVTPENIYATANISAFAALLSLVALVVGIITLMLTHERSLLSTMKTSYEFMKELSEGYHAGIAEIKRKRGGSAEMDKQLSEFVQTMHALPWRELRESIDQQQLEELFKVLVNVPQTIAQAQDMAWSVCVALRRIFGLTADYCIPSERHAPSKIIIDFKDPNGDLYAQHAQLIFDLRGEYLEKGLSECVENWHKQAQDQIVDLFPINGDSDRLPDDTTLNYYKSLSSMIAIKPRVFEKLMIHQYNQDVNIWSTLFGIDIMLINRFVLHNDPDWHIDFVQIANIQTFPMDVILYNPTDITATTPNIQIMVKKIKVRDPLFDMFSEFHIFAAKQSVLDNITHLETYRTVEYTHVRSPFIRPDQTHKLFKRDQAQKKIITMDRDRKQWTVKSKSFPEQSAADIECSFKASMDKPLHKKTSWQFCKETQEEVPPIIFFDEIEVRITGNSNASGTYKLNDNPFEIGYFAQYDPNTNLIFVMKKPPFIYRLFMAKRPDYQWYIQRFHSESRAINICRLSINLNGDDRHSAANTRYDLCTHVVPYKHWTPNTNPAIKQLRALSVEFSYDKDRIHSIYLIYQRRIGVNEISDENSISLLQQILIKGSDIYFKIYTKKDDQNLDKHYNQIVLDMTTFNVMTSLVGMCDPPRNSTTKLPTLQLREYNGKVEAIGGRIEGKFIIVFYQPDDCRNLMNTIGLYSQPVSFIN